jgi:iron-sulfur cluster repair protein YtfE (RIC family)
MTSVTTAGHEHHQRIMAMLDGIPALAGMLDERPQPTRLGERFASLHAFITSTLLAHMDVVEANVYPELERLMQNRHSMTPMRREHEEVKGLIERLGTFGQSVQAGALGPSASIGLRRVLYRLYALLKVHLAEEEEYLRVLEHNLSEDEQAELARGLEHAGAQPL